MPYRVGILGSGFGATVHAPSYQAHPAFELVAIASPNKAVEIAKNRQIAYAFPSLEAMLDGVDLDLVSIAVPPYAHYEAVELALSRNKHVLTEKPLTTNVAHAAELVELAKGAGTVCGVAHEFRFTPSRLAIRDLLERGVLGYPREIEITDLRNFLRATVQDRSSWWFSQARGGGLAQAVTSHYIDNANWIAGRAPLRVSGFSRTAIPDHRTPSGTPIRSDVPDGVFALLDYGDGLVARVTTDGTVSHDSHVFAVYGDDCAAIASGANHYDMRAFTVSAEDTVEIDLRPSPYATFASENANVPLFMQLLDEVLKKLLGEPNALPTFEEALVTQRVLQELGYSA